jgi:hypothetical protein
MAARTDRRHFINSALAGTAGAGAFLSLEEKILGSALDGGATPLTRASRWRAARFAA